MLQSMSDDSRNASERPVRLFKSGRNQAVRIPHGFELPGDEAIMRKEGNRLILEPVRPLSLLALLDRLEALDEPFPRILDAPAGPVDL